MIVSRNPHYPLKKYGYTELKQSFYKIDFVHIFLLIFVVKIFTMLNCLLMLNK